MAEDGTGAASSALGEEGTSALVASALVAWDAIRSDSLASLSAGRSETVPRFASRVVADEGSGAEASESPGLGDGMSALVGRSPVVGAETIVCWSGFGPGAMVSRLPASVFVDDRIRRSKTVFSNQSLSSLTDVPGKSANWRQAWLSVSSQTCVASERSLNDSTFRCDVSAVPSPPHEGCQFALSNV